MRNAIARVHDNTGVHTRAVQRQQRLNGDITPLKSELKHRLVQLFSVLCRVSCRLGDDNVLMAWFCVQNIEAVLPDLLHLSPICYLAVLDWIRQV